MKISLISVGARRIRSKRAVEDLLTAQYLNRAGRYLSTEGSWVENETHFWAAVHQASGRTTARVMLMDVDGQIQSSLEFAESLGDIRDQGYQHLFVGIGGPDGWDASSRKRADLVLSIGRWTLTHGLARVVVAEQIYRALTILQGHPYHIGH